MSAAINTEDEAPVQNTNSGRPALKLERVSKFFFQGKRRIAALQEVSIRIARGRITGLIGPCSISMPSPIR